VTRIPLLYDARIVVAEPGEDDVVLRPPLPRESLEDVGQAVRDALQFPLEGEPLEQLVKRGGTATIVIEQPALPIPAVQVGPRHLAIAAVADELERLGVRQTTILVAGGLMRRTTPRDIGTLVPPDFRRRFKGRVIVHDAEGDDLVELGQAGSVTLRVNPALVETDLVVVVSAAETVLHGGPGTLLAAAGAATQRLATSGRGSTCILTSTSAALEGCLPDAHGSASVFGSAGVWRTRIARAAAPASGSSLVSRAERTRP